MGAPGAFYFDANTEGKSVDRIVLMENQTYGQRVMAYRVDLVSSSGAVLELRQWKSHRAQTH